jgi:hypothetical protein
MAMTKGSSSDKPCKPSADFSQPQLHALEVCMLFKRKKVLGKRGGRERAKQRGRSQSSLHNLEITQFKYEESLSRLYLPLKMLRKSH